MKGKSKKSALLAASVAGLLAVAGAVAKAGVVYAADVECHGINACKGQGECGGKSHGCAGKNECKGQGWISKATEEECINAGGTTTAPEMPSAAPVAG